jgi:uncharacterized membrane protein HdeD (DUF308 family)
MLTLRHGWSLLLIRGVAGIVFGVLAMAWPISTAIALAVLWGFWALVDGVSWLARAFGPGRIGGPDRVWWILMGAVSLLAAFFALFSPGVTAVTLTWILGIWLIVRGGADVAGAFSQRGATRGLVLLGAATSILLGILFAANPGAGAVGIAVTLGIFAVVWGVFLVLAAFAARRDEATVTDSTA